MRVYVPSELSYGVMDNKLDKDICLMRTSRHLGADSIESISESGVMQFFDFSLVSLVLDLFYVIYLM